MLIELTFSTGADVNIIPLWEKDTKNVFFVDVYGYSIDITTIWRKGAIWNLLLEQLCARFFLVRVK